MDETFQLAEGREGDTITESGTTAEELLWITSVSLLTASQSCTDVATQSSLFQYQAAATEQEYSGFNDQDLENVRRSLEAAQEDIELALDAIEELNRRTSASE